MLGKLVTSTLSDLHYYYHSLYRIIPVGHHVDYVGYFNVGDVALVIAYVPGNEREYVDDAALLLTIDGTLGWTYACYLKVL